MEFHPYNCCQTDDHGNADRLSRLPLCISPPDGPNADPKVFNISQMEALPVMFHHLRAATSSDRVLSKVHRYTKGVCSHQLPADLYPFFNHRNKLTVKESCLLCMGVACCHTPESETEVATGLEPHKDYPGVAHMKS